MSEAFLSASWYRVAGFRPRLRPHAEIHAHRYGDRTWYVLQDHASGRVHRFTPTTYLIFSRMDGKRTVDEIWCSVAEQVEDDAPTQDEVIGLLSQLHAADLIQLDTTPDARELLERQRRHKRQTRNAILKSPLSTKVKLWDPDRFLARLVAVARPVPAFAIGVLWLAVVLPALAVVPLYWSELTNNITDQVLSAQNLAVLALVYPVVKLLHELGHGLAAKAQGCEVHETGVMLLVFYPVPYVDASASLAIRSKYGRAFVGAAGMVVELFVAALAFYAWMVVEDGLFRAVLFNVMLVAGVSTLLVNGNPLLRFDAYYILADLLEIPNLGSRANRYWGYLVQRHVFGARDQTFEASRHEPKWLFLFAPAAFVYRLVVLFGIALFVASEFFVVGVVLALWSVTTGLALPLWKALKHVVASPALHRERKRAVAVTFGGLATAAVLILAVPLPIHTMSEGVVWLPEDAQVRAGTNGFVHRLLVEAGTPVRAGTPLIESVEPSLETNLRVQRARIDELRLRLAAELVSDRVKAEITRRELEEEAAQLERLEYRARRLVVRAASEGVLTLPNAADLPGRFFREGQVIGYVTPAGGRSVRVVVPQDDIDLVRHRLADIEAKIAGRLDETFRGLIAREVPAARNELPSRALSTAGGGRFASDPTDRDGLKVLQRLFQFDVELAPDPGMTDFGGRVYVRFNHMPEPLAFQAYRRVRQLFLSQFQA